MLLFLVPMSFQFSVREIFNNYILLFSCYGFCVFTMPPSLTLVALIGVSAFLSVVVMSSSYLLTAFASFRLKTGKSYVWSLCTLILLLYVLHLCCQCSYLQGESHLYFLSIHCVLSILTTCLFWVADVTCQILLHIKLTCCWIRFSGFMLNLPSIDTFDSAFILCGLFGLGMSFFFTYT